MAASDETQQQQESNQSYSAVVLGGTGATGRQLIAQLLRDPRCRFIRSIGRRSVAPLVSPLLSASEIDDLLSNRQRFDDFTIDSLSQVTAEHFKLPSSSSSTTTNSQQLNDHEEDSSDQHHHEEEQEEQQQQTATNSVDVVFCGLGTTLKNAGSKERFVEIDHDLLIELARRAKEAGVPFFSYVSASGADANAMVFYSRIKGTNENDLAALQFPRLSIFRPALLLTAREESRPGESFAQAVFPAIEWMFPKKYKSISTETVARAMIKEFSAFVPPSADSPVSVRFIENHIIHDLGKISQ